MNDYKDFGRILQERKEDEAFEQTMGMLISFALGAITALCLALAI